MREQAGVHCATLVAMRKQQRLLIAGASGKLGRQAAEVALESCSPRELVLVSRTPKALADFAARGAAVRFGDFAAADSLPEAFAGADRMLLVSATDLEHRAAQHSAAIDAAIGAGVRHVIYTSCLSPEPPNPAAVAPSHFATERYVASAGVAFTILRNGLYSEYQAPDALRAIETGKLVHNWGAGRIAHVSRDDCAAAAAAVLVGQGHDGAVYDITGGEALGAAELAKLYGELGGCRVEAVNVDDDTFVAGMIGDAAGDDHRKYGAALVASFGRAIREGFMASRTTSVARLTGRRPRTLRETLTPLLRAEPRAGVAPSGVD